MKLKSRISEMFRCLQQGKMQENLVMNLLILLFSICLFSSSAEAILEGKLLKIHDTNPLAIYDINTLYKSPSPFQTRFKRSSSQVSTSISKNQFVDACQSKVEVITPYYARNSKGKLRTIVNSEQMQQAIQIESCVRSSTANHHPSGCSSQATPNECFCEQKYKWHRLLVLDSKDSELSQGLFMDWFLFPSSCSCRCRLNSQRIFTSLSTIGHQKLASSIASGSIINDNKYGP